MDAMELRVPNEIIVPAAVQKIRKKIKKKQSGDKNSFSRSEIERTKEDSFVFSSTEEVPRPCGIEECEKNMMLSQEEQGLVQVKETEIYVFEGAVDEESGSQSQHTMWTLTRKCSSLYQPSTSLTESSTAH